MAYDRYDPEERRWRDEDERRAMGRDRDPRFEDRGPRFEDRGPQRGERGFFDRMGDEVRSWFGDEDRGHSRDDRRGREGEDWREWSNSSERQYNPRWRDELGRGPAHMREEHDDRFDRENDTEWNRDPYRSTTFAGSRARSNHDDLHYEEWRRRQVEDLDRDYDEYRRERQSNFEQDFGGWRDKRQSKRDLLRGIREHMEVVGSDEEHVGTVDRTAGDRLILTKSDADSGGVHHSFSCADLDRVEGDRVILGCTADEARSRWRDESRSRALFEREDQGEMGDRVLDRSFSGTYR